MMKAQILWLLIILSFGILAPGQSTSEWSGIVPLETTRSEVARLLGEPKFVYKNADLFFRPGEKVHIEYAAGRCKGLLPNWDVKRGTVLSVYVKPMKPVPFDADKLGIGFVRGLVNDDLSVEYSNSKNGVKYSVNEFGELSSISYTPDRISGAKFVCKK